MRRKLASRKGKKRNPLIFIVEDDNLYQEMLKVQLKKLKSVNVKMFNSAEACLRKLSKNPTVVLLDYHLGNGMNGVELLKIIKEQKPNTEVIMLSSEESDEVLYTCMKNGAFDYVRKSEGSLNRVGFLISKIIRINRLLEAQKATKKMRMIGALSLLVLATIIAAISLEIPAFFNFSMN